MNLTLKIISHHQQQLGDAASKSFDDKGGSFGRSDDNAWVIPDDSRVVSGQHGMIFFEDGHFHLMDISKNGIYINDNASPLGKGQVTALQEGDVLVFGDYQVKVELTGDADDGPLPTPVPREPPAGIDESREASAEVEVAELPDSPMAEAHGGDFDVAPADSPRNVGFQAGDLPNEPDFDPLASFGNGQDRQQRGPDHRSGSRDNDEAALHNLINDNHAPQGSAFNPGNVKLDSDLGTGPAGEAPQELIPEDWDKTSFNTALEEFPGGDSDNLRPAAASIPQPSPSQPPPASERVEAPRVEPRQPPAQHQQADAWRAFLQGAGLDAEFLAALGDAPGQMSMAGSLFREMVQGLMVLLQSRAELKNQFRMSLTTVKPTENNPLKFTPQVDDALKTLLANDRHGFLRSDEAVTEAVADIKNHQIAMIVAMHAGIEALLGKFDPRRFARSETQGLVKSTLLPSGKNARAWEDYCKYYDQVVHESGNAFQLLFAEEFNEAYEEQLRRLDSGDNRRG